MKRERRGLRLCSSRAKTPAFVNKPHFPGFSTHAAKAAVSYTHRAGDHIPVMMGLGPTPSPVHATPYGQPSATRSAQRPKGGITIAFNACLDGTPLAKCLRYPPARGDGSSPVTG